MDNFEGRSTMNTYTPVNTGSVSPVSNNTLPPSGEVEMSREVETPIVRTEANVREENTESTKPLADSLLKFTKKNGISKAFEKLANGDDFQDPDKETQSDKITPTKDFSTTKVDTGPKINEESDADKNLQEDDKKLEVYRKQTLVEYLSHELEGDPVYKQKLGEVASEMIAAGEYLDPKILKDEALSRYVEERNADLPTSLEGKINAIETEFSQLLEENEDLRKELQEFKELVKQQAESMNAMAAAMLELAKKLRQEEEDEEEKMTLLEMMVRLMALLMQEMVRYEEKNGQQNGVKKENNSNGKTVIQLPDIKIGNSQKDTKASQKSESSEAV